MSSRKGTKIIGCRPTRFVPYECNDPMFCEKCLHRGCPESCEIFRQVKSYVMIREKVVK